MTIDWGCCAGGRKRRKVMKTFINDAGEELTEAVWEDDGDGGDGGGAGGAGEAAGEAASPPPTKVSWPTSTCVQYTTATMLNGILNIFACSGMRSIW